MIITIDGPSASGKSSAAKTLADILGYYYLNTGMLYRAVTYVLLHTYHYTDQTLPQVTEDDIKQCANLERMKYHYDPVHGVQVWYDDQEITTYLKDASIDQAVCLLSPLAHVRERLSEFQREIAAEYNVVIEGRDTGTVVFPYADYKFYITASLDVRAERWQKDQQKRGHHYTLQECKDRLTYRDTKDTERNHSPLAIPEGALVVDTSSIDKKQTVQILLDVIQKDQ